MFQKILIPLDGSEHSSRALDVGIQIAKRFEGKITLIHVYSVTLHPFLAPEPTTLTPPAVPIMTPMETSEIAEAARKAGTQVLTKGEEKTRAEGVQVETLLREGHVVQEIVSVASEGKFDLIVMGARGVGKLKEILLGSVSDGVLRNAHCPVLVVK